MRSQDFMVCADIHGDKQDRKAVKLFFEHADLIRPKHRIIAGDVFDFRAWRKGAEESEKRERVRRDFKAGMEFIERFRPTAITLGNHDVRMWDQVENSGPMADLCEDMIERFEALTNKLGTKVLPYDAAKGIYRLGRMKVGHGFFSGVNSAQRMAQAYGSILFGHIHSIDVASSPSDERRAARCIGCLCQLRYTYNRAHVAALRQAHGWAYGSVYGDGRFHVAQSEIIGGRAVVSEGFKVLAA
jgi:hypothetical protein